MCVETNKDLNPPRTAMGYYASAGMGISGRMPARSNQAATAALKSAISITITEAKENSGFHKPADLEVGQAFKFKLTGNVVARLAENVFVKVFADGHKAPTFFAKGDFLYTSWGDQSVLLPQGSTLTIKLL